MKTMDPAPIEGAASTTPLKAIPARAEWTVNAEEKCSAASILGGVATIRRRPDTGKFEGTFVLPNPAPAPAEGEEPAAAGAINKTIPLHDCPNLVVAQQRCEALIRESLEKTHPEVHATQVAVESQEVIEAAGPDPF